MYKCQLLNMTWILSTKTVYFRVHKDHIPSTTPGLLSRMFIHLSSLLRWRLAKAVVVVTSLALTALRCLSGHVNGVLFGDPN